MAEAVPEQHARNHPKTQGILPINPSNRHRPRWDSNPRITDLQSVPLVHLGTRPKSGRIRTGGRICNVFNGFGRAGGHPRSPLAAGSGAMVASPRGGPGRFVSPIQSTREPARQRSGIARWAATTAATSSSWSSDRSTGRGSARRSTAPRRSVSRGGSPISQAVEVILLVPAILTISG